MNSLFKALAVVIIIGVAASSFNIASNLPEIDMLRDVRMQVPLRVYSQDGSLLGEFGEKRRVPVLIDEVPEQLIQAFIAAEDDRFYAHPGVDWQGLLRAAISLVRTGEKRQGGSTITMQVARNFFLSREKTYMRKLNEIFLAIKIERELTKNEILELYLNKIYLGQRAYGVGAAAQVYYGAGITGLNLAQHAMLAGLPKAPSRTNPVTSPEQAVQRRSYVLRRMLELGHIDQARFQVADNAPVTASLHSPSIDLEAPYVAEMVRKHLVEEYGDSAYSAGYVVTTTIRDTLQVAANRALNRALLQYDERHGYRGPEQHYELTPGMTGDGWDQLLAAHSAVAGLLPALIIDERGFAASAWVQGIGRVELDWNSLGWARRYINENVRGPAPTNTGEVVSVGDIVRVREDSDGNWRLAQIPDIEGGLVSLDPHNGAALALVGGFEFYRSKFNRITQAERQPGSSFKPFIYSAALENGFTAASIINDAPIVYDDPSIEDKWRPENYSGRTFGPTRLREALRRSRNLVSIRLLHAMGVRNALRHVEKFGFDIDELPRNLSLALGTGSITPWQLASSYTVLANGGYRVEPFFITRIETYTGDLLFEAQPATVCSHCPDNGTTGVESAETGTADESGTADAVPVENIAERVVNPQNIWIMNELTRDVVRRGTGARAYRELQRDDLSGKTGTTNEQRDAWFAGFNSSVVAVTWVGFDDFEPMGQGEVGGRTALSIWIEYMRTALKDTPVNLGERPADIVTIRINAETGCPAGAGDTDAEFEVFMANRLPDATECSRMLIPYDNSPEKPDAPGRLF
ncbi:MAG: penicillin-binding protein 1A [Gammaproteobacteria bacterium]|nr:penicillin-binding protein 1A [Gammaproteobacteria bacterium]